MEDWVEMIMNKSALESNLTFASLYIAIYENFVYRVVDNIKLLLCDWGVKDGTEYVTETETYKSSIKNRIVDEFGNKDITKASFLLLKDWGAIDDTDYELFLKIKKNRNNFAHELFRVVLKGVTDDEIISFIEMINLQKKTTSWWFVNVEASIDDYDLPDDFDYSNVSNLDCLVWQVVIDVLYRDKSDEYKKILDSIRNNEA
ncbi:MAG: hypothetical protein IKS90_00260 [Clostridia bacterium]|nr:hypothetical protein [Clostridia bacterium]